MYITTTETARSGGLRALLGRAEDWLDRRGKWAWITLMILGFVLFWPLGLLLLAYMIWGKHMFTSACHRRARDHHGFHPGFRTGQTGNQAFDSYKAQALCRLEEEQAAFEAFLQRLRMSKDKTEFDAFMEERARTTATQDQAEDTPAPQSGTTPRPGEY